VGELEDLNQQKGGLKMDLVLMEEMTYAELIEYNKENEKEMKEEQATIEHDSGVEEDDDIFLNMQIVSPYDSQKLLDTYVPKSMEKYLIAEKECAITDKYFDWTSELSREAEGEIYDTEAEAEEKIIEIIEEFKNKYERLDYVNYEIKEIYQDKYYIRLINSGLYLG
jgi:hypothetical protein